MIDPPVVPTGVRVVGIGVDVVDVARIRAALERTPGLGPRTFSDAERAEAARAADGGRRLAWSFAAKEAAVKALGCGISKVRLRAIELVTDGAALRLVLAGPAEAIAAAAGVASTVVTIVDRGDHVVAAVVLTAS